MNERITRRTAEPGPPTPVQLHVPDAATIDKIMMERCIALARRSGEQGEYPYGAVICRNGEVVVETTNRVHRDRDVTRHAEVVAISEAQKVLDRTSLDDCTIYTNAEPCAYCCYSIRESRINRVVYGMRSPVMGGFSRWSILADTRLSDTLPEVFAPPPEIVPDFMRAEAEAALAEGNPLFWKFIRSRGIFGGGPTSPALVRAYARPHSPRLWQLIMAGLRRTIFDRFGRR